MDNSAFSDETVDSPASDGAPSSLPSPPPIEMKTQKPTEEKQPLCRCDSHCACLEAAAPPAGRAPNVQLKSWNRVKTAVLAAGVVALLVWCGVMAAMYHYGVL